MCFHPGWPEGNLRTWWQVGKLYFTRSEAGVNQLAGVNRWTGEGRVTESLCVALPELPGTAEVPGGKESHG